MTLIYDWYGPSSVRNSMEGKEVCGGLRMGLNRFVAPFCMIGHGSGNYDGVTSTHVEISHNNDCIPRYEKPCTLIVQKQASDENQYLPNDVTASSLS